MAYFCAPNLVGLGRVLERDWRKMAREGEIYFLFFFFLASFAGLLFLRSFTSEIGFIRQAAVVHWSCIVASLRRASTILWRAD